MVEAVASPGMMTAKQEQEWRAESDLNTLIEAEKIKKDPKRLKMVMERKKSLLKALETAGK